MRLPKKAKTKHGKHGGRKREREGETRRYRIGGSVGGLLAFVFSVLPGFSAPPTLSMNDILLKRLIEF